ncbi:MAG: polysaccharide biosynthesis protein [Clostridia bacterium]|nr:polysaccharide biosynthesis protein [Clostridia bacterium]
MRKKTIGVVLSYLLIVVDILVSLFFVPYLLKSLGDSEYGIYRLMLSTASYLSILDFGIGGTLTRYIVKFKTEQDKKGIENFSAMGLFIYGALALLVILISVGVALFIPSMYKASIPSELSREAQYIFVIICSTTAVSLFNHGYNGIITAYEGFAFNKSSNILKIALRILLIIFGLKIFNSALVVVIIDFALAVLLLIANALYVRFYVKCKVRLHKWDWKLAKEAFVFTLAILMQSIINQFNSNVDNIVLGIYMTASVVTLYSLALQIYTIFGSLSTAISSVYLPSISETVFKGATDEEITRKVVEPSRIQLIVLLLALTGFYLFGQDFITLWVGEGYEQVYVLCCVLLTSSILDLSQNSITCVLKAKNMLHGKTLILGIATIVNVIITFVLVPIIGAVGATIGTAFSMLFGYGVALNIYFQKKVHLKMGLYYKETYKGILLAVIIAAVIGVAFTFIKMQGWIGFLIKAGLYAIVYCVIILLIGLNANEKQMVKRIFKRKKL